MDPGTFAALIVVYLIGFAACYAWLWVTGDYAVGAMALLWPLLVPLAVALLLLAGVIVVLEWAAKIGRER